MEDLTGQLPRAFEEGDCVSSCVRGPRLGRRRSGGIRRAVRSILSRTLSVRINSAIGKRILDVRSERTVMKVVKNKIRKIVPCGRLSTGPFSRIARVLGMNSIISLIIVGRVGSGRGKDFLLSGHHVSTGVI